MAKDLAPLNRAQLHILTTLHEAGGAGELDIHGRLKGAGPKGAPLPGDTVTWLILVSRGVVAGEDGMIITTERGREIAESVLAGRTREAS
jgi:hypothetical protein